MVLVASKGQPMSIAFDHDTPLVLFASEAEALNVSVRESGKVNCCYCSWLVSAVFACYWCSGVGNIREP